MSELVGSCLIDLVDVGTLFAVDFDVDEVLVHEPGGIGVREALVVHHVAPVTRGVADREEDRLVARLGRLKRFGPPRVPVHRVVLVKQEIGARFVG